MSKINIPEAKKALEKFRKESIDSVAKDLCSRYSICTCENRDGHCSTPQQHARIICELGYRKTSEVANEIIDKVTDIVIDNISKHLDSDCSFIETEADITKELAELRKSYGGQK